MWLSDVYLVDARDFQRTTLKKKKKIMKLPL